MNGVAPYPEYVDSGIKWLGDMPFGWTIRALRYLATVETGSRDTVDADPDGKYPFIVRSPTLLRIGSFSYDTEAILTAGDGDVGEIFHHLTGKFDVHQRVYVLKDFRGVVPRFLYYFFSSQFRNVVAYGGVQTTVSSLRRPMFTSFPVLVPDLQAQVAIARFLDRESAEIDAFIADQEELVELLAERRAATISYATTIGLDPTVPMKDSGAEWIGDVPRDWQVKPVRSIVRRLESGTSVNAADWPAGPGEIGVLKTSCVYSGEFDPTENKKVDPADLRRVSCPVRRGAVIVSRMNTAALVGAAGLVRDEAVGLFLPDRLWQLQVEGDPRFFHYWTKSRSYRSQVALAAEGTSSSMLNIGQRDLLSMKIAVPPSTAIAGILDHLDEEVARFDAAIADAREAIALSRERRAALISAAVTGKIDVRHGA